MEVELDVQLAHCFCLQGRSAKLKWDGFKWLDATCACCMRSGLQAGDPEAQLPAVIMLILVCRGVVIRTSCKPLAIDSNPA